MTQDGAPTPGRGTIEGFTWPVLREERKDVTQHHLQHWLEHSQWLDAGTLRQRQLSQLAAVMAHASRHVPYYRGRLDGLGDGRALEEAAWRDLPRLTRAELQAHGRELLSERLPRGHGVVAPLRTSGSTGRPVETTLSQAAGDSSALAIRRHVWAGRDPSLKMAAIRNTQGEARFPKGRKFSTWVSAWSVLRKTGPMVVLSIATPIDRQLTWLTRENPHYLLTYPSNLEGLLAASIKRGLRPRRLLQVGTFAEALSDDLRERCLDVWGVPLVDGYSAEEMGPIAFQCPDADHYHVQAESVLVEVLDDQGEPCDPGTVGRIVVSSLHEFSTPLLRYDIGDYAEPGPPCPCGRGLPVLKRILGRVRNRLVLPDGQTVWPSFGSRGLTAIAPVLQHQYVQTAGDRIELRLVTARPLTDTEERSVREHVAARLPCPFQLEIRYPGELARSPSGKFEDFISQVTVP